MVFLEAEDLNRIQPGDQLTVADVASSLRTGEKILRIFNETQRSRFDVTIDLDDKERKFVVSGGRLNWFRQKQGKQAIS
jgi:hypothetical protein